MTAVSITGPRPPWWRPFARRRWDRAVRAIVAQISLAILDAAARVAVQRLHRIAVARGALKEVN